MFKKSLITAVAFMALFLSGATMAGSWDPSSDGVAPIFATELSAAGTDVLSPDTAMYTLAVAKGDGTSFLVDYTLTGATWGAALTSAGMAYNEPVAHSGAYTILLTSGGGLTESTAQYRVDVTNQTSPGDQLILTYSITGTTGLSTAAGTVKMSIALTDTLGAVDTPGAAGNVATAAVGTAATASGTFAASTGSAAGGVQMIDVGTGSLKFNSTAPSNSIVIGNVTLADGTAVESDNTAWGTNSGDAAVTGGSIVVTGDFAAAVAYDGDASANTNDGAVLSGCLAANATSINATTATFTLTAANVAAIEAAGACAITMNVDGATIIEEGTYSIALTIDYTTATVTDHATTVAGYTLSRNGDTVDLDLVLTPGGAFSNYVRISNKSAVPGIVIVTMWNDAGSSVTYNLSTVTGETGTLAGQASTGLITVQALYDAAVAADATFAHSDGKLRARFEGEFSTIAAQSITLSTDSTTFSTF